MFGLAGLGCYIYRVIGIKNNKGYEKFKISTVRGTSIR